MIQLLNAEDMIGKTIKTLGKGLSNKEHYPSNTFSIIFEDDSFIVIESCSDYRGEYHESFYITQKNIYDKTWSDNLNMLHELGEITYDEINKYTKDIEFQSAKEKLRMLKLNFPSLFE